MPYEWKEHGMHSYSHFTMWCPMCKFETEEVKIRDDYRKKTKLEAEDVTPYKPTFFKRFLRKIYDNL